MDVDRLNRTKFSWKGLSLHYGRADKPQPSPLVMGRRGDGEA